MFKKINKVDFISKSKGIATSTDRPHYYQIKLTGDKDFINIFIKSKKIQETIERTDIKGPTPVNYSDDIYSTELSIIMVSDQSILYTDSTEGEAGDEWILARYGYYITNYDELNEVRHIKRLIDMAKYI